MGLISERAQLTARDYTLNLDSRLGKTQVRYMNVLLYNITSGHYHYDLQQVSAKVPPKLSPISFFPRFPLTEQHRSLATRQPYPSKQATTAPYATVYSRCAEFPPPFYPSKTHISETLRMFNVLHISSTHHTNTRDNTGLCDVSGPHQR